MKIIKIIAAFFLVIVCVNQTKAQTTITPQSAKLHIGDSVQVCDIVLEAKYIQQAKDSPTRLYMGSRQPNPMLTIVIKDDVKRLMKYDPEKKLVNAKICVRGKVSAYEGRPAIIVESPADIQLQ